MVNNQCLARANGKTRVMFTINTALMKAIKILEKTPDEEDKTDGE